MENHHLYLEVWTFNVASIMVLVHTSTVVHSMIRSMRRPLLVLASIITWLGVADQDGAKWEANHPCQMMPNVSQIFQKPSKTIKNHQKPSKTIKIHQKPSKTIKNHQKPSKTIKNHQKPSKTIKNHQKPSKTIKNHQKPIEFNRNFEKPGARFGTFLDHETSHVRPHRSRCSWGSALASLP